MSLNLVDGSTSSPPRKGTRLAVGQPVTGRAHARSVDARRSRVSFVRLMDPNTWLREAQGLLPQPDCVQVAGAPSQRPDPHPAGLWTACLLGANSVISPGCVASLVSKFCWPGLEHQDLFSVS